MKTQKNETKALCLKVTDNLSVKVIPDQIHEFLMPTKDVASGFGVSNYAISWHRMEHYEELIEGKHYLSNVSIPHSAANGSSRGVMWTKRGIVRLGFFIKSPTAVLFRDWAEELIIRLNEQVDLFGVRIQKLAPISRNHNRLSPNRLVDIMADVALIDQKDIRERLVNKLMQKGGQA